MDARRVRAAIRRGPKIVVDLMPDPVPLAGQVLVRTLHCGICGSDLHAVQHMQAMADYGRRTGIATGDMDPDQDLVFGHEFCAEIMEFGPDTQRTLAIGTPVCAMPSNFDSKGLQVIGFSNRYNGGFAQYMVLTEKLLCPVTNGLDSRAASLAEPMAVAVHAVNRTDHGHCAYMIVGCGPVGLSIIAELKSRRLGPIVALDLIPERRAIAATLGADGILDPADFDPARFWVEFRAGQRAAGEGQKRRPVIYECVGVPGTLNMVINAAPAAAQIVIAGVCMAPDQIEPSIAMNKELDLKFAIGYSRREFGDTVRRLCDGELDVGPMISEVIGLDAVPAAFEALLRRPRKAKVLVDPRL
jgi:threonine dehydrogenase-like Zn-dependent dehydrogenase